MARLAAVMIGVVMATAVHPATRAAARSGAVTSAQADLPVQETEAAAVAATIIQGAIQTGTEETADLQRCGWSEQLHSCSLFYLLKNSVMNTLSLIHTLTQCAKHCDECSAASLQEKHTEHLASCISHTILCADTCRLTAKMLLHRGPHQPLMVELCIAVCNSCEASCRQHDYTHCKECAIVCRECAEACAEFLATYQCTPDAVQSASPPY